MTPAGWSAPLASYLWQVALHAWVLGLILYAWARYVGLPSGGTKRRLLALVLALPPITAAVPGRSSLEFAEGTAWLDSARVLAIPLAWDWRVSHLIFTGAMAMVLLTIWQEVSVAAHRPKPSRAAPPASLVARARALPAWARCDVALVADASILVATTGRPGRPRLLVSIGALAGLDDAELDTVLAHEHAHWQNGRWWQLHVLYVLHLLQCYHPVSLWAFREYCVEVEVACDAAAAGKGDRRRLARILLRLYRSTDPDDAAARAMLQKRVDVLMAGGPVPASLPTPTVVAAAGLMLLVLPWIV